MKAFIVNVLTRIVGILTAKIFHICMTTKGEIKLLTYLYPDGVTFGAMKELAGSWPEHKARLLLAKCMEQYEGEAVEIGLVEQEEKDIRLSPWWGLK